MQLLAVFRKSPFARLLFFYTAGILSPGIFSTTECLSGPGIAYITLFLTATLLLTVCLQPGYNTGWLSGLLSGMVLLFAGFVNMNNHNQAGNHYKKTAETKGLFVFEISQPPEINEKTIRALATIKGYWVKGVWNADCQKIIIFIEKDTLSEHLNPGDRILAASKLYGVSPPGNPGEFDFKKYLATKGIYNQAYLEKGLWKVIGYDNKKSIHGLAFQMQRKLLQAFQKIGMNNTHYSLLSALTLGYKNDLEARTKQLFSQAGVMHVMALSGFNVAVIALVLSYLLIFTERSVTGRILKTIVIISVIWLFAFITGLSASVTRAAVMISFVITGKLIHRRINTYNILFASAFFLLALSPALIFDISFQLSFAAVMGIIIYQPVLYRLLSFNKLFADKIWQLFTLSCAAQFSTLPLTLYYFHQFPVYFWLTNLYVVPLVSVIICIAGVFLLVSSLDPIMLIVGKALTILITVLYKSVALTEILPFSLIEDIHINLAQSMVLISIVLFMGMFLVLKKIGYLWLVLCCVAVFQLMNTLNASNWRNQKVLLVGDVKGISAVNLISGRNGILLGDTTLFSEDTKLQYAFRNFWTEHGVAGHISSVKFSDQKNAAIQNIPFYKSVWLENNLFFDFSGKRIIVLTDNSLFKLETSSPLKTDLVIITGNIKPDIKSLANLLDSDQLILDASVRKYQAVQWIKACKEQDIKCWNVSEQGAYMLSIR